MADFKRGGFGGDRGGKSWKKSFGGGPSRGSGQGGFGGGGGQRSSFNRPGNHEFRQAQMFSTTCAECHKPCEVPFRPTGERPVYCSYCFGKNKAGGEGSSSFEKRSFNSSPVPRPENTG